MSVSKRIKDERIDKENAIHLPNGIITQIEIRKFSGKWMELEKDKHPEWDKQVPERQIWYIFTYIWYKLLSLQ